MKLPGAHLTKHARSDDVTDLYLGWINLRALHHIREYALEEKGFLLLPTNLQPPMRH